MTRSMKLTAAALGIAALGVAVLSHAQSKGTLPQMSFFVTSTTPKTGDLGGLAGADKLCQDLAKAEGAGNRSWRAYLSTSTYGGGKQVNARERIGRGPWYNAKGVLIARNIDELHDPERNAISAQNGLTEKGAMITGRGMHDILTGSDSQGRAFPGEMDTTCSNWTSSAAGGSAMLGHFDRRGSSELLHMKSWVQAHPSVGCNQDALRRTGGQGLLYCFAAR